MRDLRELNEYRNSAWELKGYGFVLRPEEMAFAGCFIIPSVIDRADLRCVVSCVLGTGWDHVSISKRKRVPNWYEMEQVKRLFFKADEVALQYHVPSSDHVNTHPHCLHLWRPHDQTIPMPPAEWVGIRGLELTP